MSFPSARTFERRNRPVLWVLLLVVLFAGSGLYTGVGSSSGHPAPVNAVPVAPAAHSSPPANHPSPAVPPPAPSFYHVTSNIASQATSSVYCDNSSAVSSPLSRYCFPQAQNPSALHLANGDIGVAYSLLTSHTNSSCAAASTQTNSRVGFSLSNDGGVTFGGITYLGNDTCPYVSAIEPSFGVSNSGPIYGTFVEENYTNTSNPFEPGLPPDYGNRSTDALGFVSSTDNGTTFSTVTTILSGGYIARPQLATIGNTIYIVYTNTQNGTTPLSQPPLVIRPPTMPESVEMIKSTNSGSTWSTPITLPGENSSSYYTSFGASIAVSSTGVLAVAYATNRTCLSSFGPCATAFSWLYGENVVVTTSTNNGTTWKGPYTVGLPAAEAGCYGYDNGSAATYFYPDPCLVYLFELAPQTSITFGASSSTIYVAWSGGHSYYYYYEENSNVYSAVTTNSGLTWSSTIVADPALNNTFTQEEYSTPAIGFSNGTVYLSYLEKNGTSCFISNYCSLLLGSYIEWVTSSTDGLTWTSSTFLTLQSSSEYTPRWLVSFSGYTGSIAFNSAGKPVVAFALDQRPDSSSAVIGGVSYEEFQFGTVLDVAVGGTGPTVTLTFQVAGNPVLNPWTFSVDGKNFTPTLGSTSFAVANVPAGQSVKIDGPASAPLAYATERVFQSSVPELSEFLVNSTVYFNGTTDYGLTFSYEPPQFPNFCMCLTLDGAYYIYIPLGVGFGIAEPAFPWYFPAGTKLLVQPQINEGSDPTLYYVGTGNGSHTGPGTWANLTMNGPVNETVWNGLIGNSSLNVTTSGLPSGTAYTFQVDGATYTGTAGTPVYVSNLNVGPHTVSGAQAAGTLGYEWFGTPNFADPVVPYETSVTLAFADVNLSSSLGLVAFHALGVAAGASWTLSFNGSLYAASTPWINVTSRSGTFPFATFSAVTLGGGAGYVPTTVGPTITVASGTTVDVNYTAAYQVRVAAGVGGTVTSSLTQFVAPGTPVALHATALSGYSFVGWSGTGNGSYTGPLLQTNITVSGPVDEDAVFAALPGARFNLTFTQAGIPVGTWWSVSLDGVSYAANSSVLRVSNLSSCSAGAAGLYALAVPYTTNGAVSGLRYVATTVNATVCTTGATLVPLQFTTQNLVTTTSNVPSAVVSATCDLSFGASVWCDQGSTVALSAPTIGGYVFTGWNGLGVGSYTGLLAGGHFVSAGSGAVQEVAMYSPTAPPPTYNLTLQTSPGFASGTAWTVDVSGRAYSSSSPTLVIGGLSNGSVAVSPAVAVSPDGGTRYTPGTSSTTFTVAGSSGGTLRYVVAFQGTITGGSGGTVGPAPGWFPANGTVTLSATPSAGNAFIGWASTGAGYSGTNPNGSFSATGPFSELATFAPTQAAVTTTTSAPSSIWSYPLLWAALGAAGLVAGVLVGVLLSRRGSAGPPEETQASDATPTAESEPGPEPGSSSAGGEP